MNRLNSNVFSVFDQKQIAEFKEAFSFVDQNSDGIIDRSDLREILTSLGRVPNEEELSEMMAEIPETSGGLNFTLFLAMMADKMQGVDSASELKAAFEVLDEKRAGSISITRLKEYLTAMGDPLNEDELDLIFKGVELDSQGGLDYNQFVKTLTHSDLKLD